MVTESAPNMADVQSSAPKFASDSARLQGTRSHPRILHLGISANLVTNSMTYVHLSQAAKRDIVSIYTGRATKSGSLKDSRLLTKRHEDEGTVLAGNVPRGSPGRGQGGY